LVADDGAECTPQDEVVCRWVCNGTCTDDAFAGATEVGAIYIDTEERDVNEIERSVELIGVFSS